MKELLVADRADVLVVDDQPDNLRLLVNMLSPAYNVHPFTDGAGLFRYIAAGKPLDLIMLDVVMPKPDGHDICRQLRSMRELEDIPIVFLTGLTSVEDEARGLELGAADYIPKPFSPPIVVARVGNHVRMGRALRLIMNQNDYLDERVTERTLELENRNAELHAALHQVAQTQDATIVALSALAEARDNETGKHINRTQNYVRELARALRKTEKYSSQLGDEMVDVFYKSAALHDIGKVAIPDHILLKMGRLEPDEFEIMKTHAEHGRRAIELAQKNAGGASEFLEHAKHIAHSHHEKWDGSGYPQGIQGEEIPLSARLMAVADVYDALVCKRCYKAAFTHAKAVEIILEGRGRHFDPDVVDAFESIQDVFAEIAFRFSETELDGD